MSKYITFSSPVILLPKNINNSMEIMLILTFYALTASGEGLGMKRNRERREHTQFP
jgi:hypothetical protein